MADGPLNMVCWSETYTFGLMGVERKSIYCGFYNFNYRLWNSFKQCWHWGYIMHKVVFPKGIQKTAYNMNFSQLKGGQKIHLQYKTAQSKSDPFSTELNFTWSEQGSPVIGHL